MKKDRERIMFSCLSRTDPVSNGHDAGMLHIVRHYRPDKIFFYVSKEIKETSIDCNCVTAVEKLKEKLTGYEPEFLPFYYDERDDVSNFDDFYDLFRSLLDDLSDKYPEAEFLVNVTSGSPQMQMTLSLLATEPKFRIRPVQVKGGPWVKVRFNNLDEALEHNLDNKEDAVDRCEEPKLFVFERNRQTEQVKALIEHYNYYSLLDPSDNKIPNNLMPLVKHLACRVSNDRIGAIESLLKRNELRKLYPSKYTEELSDKDLKKVFAGGLQYYKLHKGNSSRNNDSKYSDFDDDSEKSVLSRARCFSESNFDQEADSEIFPEPNKLKPAGESAFSKKEEKFFDYIDLSEYILFLDVLQKNKRYTDFVIRLNPLVITLEKAWLEKLFLKKNKKLTLSMFLTKNGRIKGEDELKKYPGFIELFQSKCEGEYQEKSSAGVPYFNCIAKWLGESECFEYSFFESLSNLNCFERNEAAHGLNNVNEDDIKEHFSGSGDEIINKLRKILEELYPQYYSEALFHIYEESNQYILQAL